MYIVTVYMITLEMKERKEERKEDRQTHVHVVIKSVLWNSLFISTCKVSI